MVIGATTVSSDIRRFGVTLDLVSISLAFLMSSEWMNLTAGILVFLAALVPIAARLWRSAVAKGRHKRILSICADTFLLISLALWTITFLFGWWGGWWGALMLLVPFAYVGSIVIRFSKGGEVVSREEIAVFVLLLVLCGALLMITYVGMQEGSRPPIRVIRVIPTPSPGASPTPSPMQTN